jgi:tRNA-specific 2-thiouridylase
MTTSRQKVYVGLSGGVDSSLAAALLQQQGYDVTGVYMKNWTLDLPGAMCPWADDLADAKRVAVQLNIPFKVYDFQTEYKHKVVDYMINEYQAGRTPNPDIMCNQEVKFKLFLETALADGADKIATGHYARIIYNSGNYKQTPTLCMAADKIKDQTYFLYRISEEALSKTIFPIGEISSKLEVRKLAKKFGLSTAERKESMGICFVGKVGIKEFLSQYVETTPGDIIEKSTGKILGEHDGAIFSTFGQRHGLDVGGSLPYYVVGKNMVKNEVYVTTDLNDESMWRQKLTLTNLHWINQSATQHLKGRSSKVLKMRLRHRAPLVNGCFENKALNKITLEIEQRAITPGQSVVIYDHEICLGGGVIT